MDFQGIKIDSVKLDTNVMLAPMAGVTDFVYRQLVRMYSKTALLTTEMLSSEALIYGNNDMICHTIEDESPIAFQLSGHKPDIMARAAKIIEPKATFIDINMGCPVNKIVKGGDGSHLMRTPELAFDIVKAVCDTVDVPVTVKFRLGYTEAEKNFIEFGQLMQSAGASAVTLHARTRAQMYAGKADWDEIALLKRNIDIPIFANGDICSVDDAIKCFDKSRADGVAIARGSIAKPYIFAHIEDYFKTGETTKEFDIIQKVELLKKHIDLEIAFRGEEFGLKFVRKFYSYYIEKIRNAASYRFLLVREIDYDKIMNILDEIVLNG